MRPSPLLLCLALAGCASANATSGVTTAKTAQAPAAAVAHSPPLAARAAQAQAAGHDDWWKEGGVTREKINAMCWMRYERGRRDMPVEKRADLVDACVIETLKQHPVR